MEDFADRERAFVDNMSATVTGVVVPILDADFNARVRNGENAIRIFNAGNVEVTSATTILGEPEPLMSKVSLPKALVTELGGMRIESADIEMTMDVSSSIEEHDLEKSEASMEGTAEADFGIFKIRTSFSAAVSTESERTRKSDYRAKTSLNIHMQTAPAPEGVMRVLDTMMKTIDTSMEINRSIIETHQKTRANQQIEEKGVTALSGNGSAPEAGGEPTG